MSRRTARSQTVVVPRLRVVYEGLPRVRVRRPLARDRVLEALNDGLRACVSAARRSQRGPRSHRLARAVAADDQRQWLGERNHTAVLGAEAADAFDEEPAQRPTHGVLVPARFCVQQGARVAPRAVTWPARAQIAPRAHTKLRPVADQRARPRCSVTAHRSTVAMAAVFNRRVARAPKPVQPSAPAGGTRLPKTAWGARKMCCLVPLSASAAAVALGGEAVPPAWCRRTTSRAP